MLMCCSMAISVSERGLDDHVPGDDHEQEEDDAHAQGPAAQLTGGFCVVAEVDGALDPNRGAALESGAEQEGGGEERKREHDPALAEVPIVAVEDEADA